MRVFCANGKQYLYPQVIATCSMKWNGHTIEETLFSAIGGDVRFIMEKKVGVKTPFILQRRDAAEHGTENAVNRSRDPGRMGGAPVHVVCRGMQDILHAADDRIRDPVPVQDRFGCSGSS